MKTATPTTADIINQAIVDANAAVAMARLNGDLRYSNGSEAWLAVQIRCDGRSRLAKELRQIEDVRYDDAYWGFLISAKDSNGQSISHYYEEDIWTQRCAASLREHGLEARQVEHLL